MKKKLLSIFLTITMVCTILSALSITAGAAGHTHDGVTFVTPISTLEQLKNLFASGGSGYLTENIIESMTANVTISGKNVALCLNGHTLQEVSTAITDNGTYSLYDCTVTGKLSSVLETWHNGAAISVSSGGTFNLYSGTITGWRAVGVGSGVYVADAASTFNMSGGSIENGKTTYKNRYGGGVYLNGGKMTMSGGTIKNNTLTSKAHGGGIYIRGAWIEWDGASVPDTAQFVMTGGEIKDNYADWSGGGIMLEAGGSFLMTGGVISGNTSGSYGRGVAIYDGDTTAFGRSWAYFKGGTVSNNSIERSVGGRMTAESQNVTFDNVTFTGSYAYTIHYDANGGTGAPTDYTATIVAAEASEAKYVLPTINPTRTGYTFAGWYTAASGGTQVTSETDLDIFAKQTIYAHWTANTYTVTLNANGGECGTLTSYTYGVGATLPTPTKAGYTFGGDAVTAISATETGDKVFYAKWDAGVSESKNTVDYPSVQAKITGDTAIMRFMWQVNFEDGAKIDNIGAYIIPWKLFDGTSIKDDDIVKCENPQIKNGDTFSVDLTGIPREKNGYDVFEKMEFAAYPFINGKLLDSYISGTVNEANIDKEVSQNEE